MKPSGEGDFNKAVGESFLENMQYELMLRSALAELYEPLVQPDAGIEVISHLILHCCKIITSSQNGLVATINADNGCMVAHAQDINTSIPFATLTEDEKLKICPFDNAELYSGLLGYSITTLRPLLANIPSEHAAYRELPPDYVKLENLMSVPVKLGTELVGVICLANSNRNYTDQDIDAAQRIAKFFALAIQRRRWERALRESQANLQALINNTSDLIWAIDTNYRVIAANNSIKDFHKLVYRVHMEVGAPILELLPTSTRGNWESLYQRALQGEHISEEQAYEVAGKKLFYDITIHPIICQGQITGASGFARDITQNKQAEEQLQLYAATDVMTGVLNRRTGLAVLENQLQLSKRNNSYLSVCFIDLNDLKGVNDRYGHKEGDAYIILVTQTLRVNIRDMDTVCRMGGDEFLVIFPQCRQKDAQAIYARIAEQLKEYNQQEIKPYPVSISHGIAEYDPGQKTTAEELVSLADGRMYEEKRLYKESLARNSL